MLDPSEYLGEFFYSESYKFLSGPIPIPLAHLSNEKTDRDLVNKLSRLELDLVCKIFIYSPIVIHEDKTI